MIETSGHKCFHEEGPDGWDAHPPEDHRRDQSLSCGSIGWVGDVSGGAADEELTEKPHKQLQSSDRRADW